MLVHSVNNKAKGEMMKISFSVRVFHLHSLKPRYGEPKIYTFKIINVNGHSLNVKPFQNKIKIQQDNNRLSIRKDITARLAFFNRNQLYINITKPGMNITLKTTWTLGKTQICDKVPGKKKFHLKATAVESRI